MKICWQAHRDLLSEVDPGCCGKKPFEEMEGLT